MNRLIWITALATALASSTTAQTLPDLVVSDMDVPTQVTPGERFNFECRVKNDSRIDAGSSRVAYNLVYQRTNGQVRIVRLGDDSSGSLDAGRSKRTDADVTFPTDAKPGGVARFACAADYLLQVTESDEDNNGLAREVTVRAPPPADLSARATASRSSVRAGQSLTVECRARNDGGTASPSGAQVSAIFSDDGSNTQTIGTGTLGAIDPDDSQTLSFNTTVPTWVRPGGEVDVVCAILRSDADDSNNSDRLTLSVEQAATPASVSVSTNLSPTSAAVVPHWQALPHLLRAAAHPDERTRDQAIDGLERWVRRGVRVFTSPSSDESTRATASLEIASQTVPDRILAETRDALARWA